MSEKQAAGAEGQAAPTRGREAASAPPHPSSQPLEESERFRPPATRRDFLGLAAAWSAVIACATAVLGALRLPMPSVFPESNSKVKIGPPDAFPKDSTTYLSHLRVWVFHGDEGLYALSSVCTHLGCIVARQESGKFLCPCHGSVFTAEGKVVGGPAPKGLNWLEMSLTPDGQIVLDKLRTVPLGTCFKVTVEAASA